MAAFKLNFPILFSVLAIQLGQCYGLECYTCYNDCESPKLIGCFGVFGDLTENYLKSIYNKDIKDFEKTNEFECFTHTWNHTSAGTFSEFRGCIYKGRDICRLELPSEDVLRGCHICDGELCNGGETENPTEPTLEIASSTDLPTTKETTIEAQEPSTTSTEETTIDTISTTISFTQTYTTESLTINPGTTEPSTIEIQPTEPPTTSTTKLQTTEPPTTSTTKLQTTEQTTTSTTKLQTTEPPTTSTTKLQTTEPPTASTTKLQTTEPPTTSTKKITTELSYQPTTIHPERTTTETQKSSEFTPTSPDLDNNSEVFGVNLMIVMIGLITIL
ncbi:hypothetical protein ACFFRR_004315 [Megaselia abdita]